MTQLKTWGASVGELAQVIGTLLIEVVHGQVQKNFKKRMTKKLFRFPWR